MTDTMYDKCVETAKERYRQEEREERAAEYLDAEKETHKPAARIWFNLLTEVWPPRNTEKYFEIVNERFGKAWNENPDNKLLKKLLLMTHEYLGEAAGKHSKLTEGK